MTQAGQLGLCATKGRLGKLIRLITRSQYNHVVISVGNGLNISAEPGGVAVRPDTYWGNTLTWSHFPYTPKQGIKATSYALAQTGKPYAWGDDILIGVALILHGHIPHWAARRLTGDGHWQCAELADATLRAAGINLFPHRTPATVYPGSFTPTWRNNGWC